MKWKILKLDHNFTIGPTELVGRNFSLTFLFSVSKFYNGNLTILVLKKEWECGVFLRSMEEFGDPRRTRGNETQISSNHETNFDVTRKEYPVK